MKSHYEDNLDSNSFYQGDVLSDYDIVMLPDKTAETQSMETSVSTTGTAQILVKRDRTNIMIISQTCDILNRDFVAICPVFPISKLTNDDRQDAVRKGRTNYRFWLPEKIGYIEESYADFQIINTIKRDNLDLASRVVALTDRYRTHLTDCLYKFFCRPITIEG